MAEHELLDFDETNVLKIINGAPVTFVTGKGGVGKTTIANLVAQRSFSHGERTLFISLNDDPTTQIHLKTNEEPGTSISPIKSELGYDVIYLTPSRALVKYLQDKKMGAIVDRLHASSLISAIANTVPGMRELLTLGAIRSLSESGAWDRVIVDAPSTGHALALFDVANSAQNVAKSGAILDQSKSAKEFLRDPLKVQVLVVTLDQFMVLEESKELIFALEEKHKLNIAGVVINKANKNTFKSQNINSALEGIFIPTYLHLNTKENKQTFFKSAFGLGKKFPSPLKNKICIPGKSKVVLVVGTGGVGKTTLTASIAYAAAKAKKKVGLLTVDPARRLGTALGLEDSKTSSATSEKSSLTIVDKTSSNFHIFQLNPQAEFFRLLESSLSKKQFKACKENSFVNAISTMGIINEYMAIEAMHRLVASNEYDLVVIDTPPSHHLRDMLDTPDAIRRAINSPIYSAFVGAGSIVGWGANKMLSTFLRPIRTLVGKDLIEDAVKFLQILKSAESEFSKHADVIKSIIASESTFRLGVGSAEIQSLNHLYNLVNVMEQANHGLNGVVINNYSVMEDDIDGVETMAKQLDKKGIASFLIEKFDRQKPVDIVSDISKHIVF